MAEGRGGRRGEATTQEREIVNLVKTVEEYLDFNAGDIASTSEVFQVFWFGLLGLLCQALEEGRIKLEDRLALWDMKTKKGGWMIGGKVI